jgi:ribosomal protein L36
VTSPNYPCGHPRTLVNSCVTAAGKKFCKACQTIRRRKARRAAAKARCEARGHARAEYINARGWVCCVTCEFEAGKVSAAKRLAQDASRQGNGNSAM